MTQIMQQFKEEPGLNAVKLWKRQIVQNIDIRFDEIKEKPKTLAGYGIRDAVSKTYFDGKIAELTEKITELTRKNQELERKIQELERKNSP